MYENIKPTYDNILVKLNQKTEKMVNGLYIPGGEVEQVPRGLVIAVGPGMLMEGGKLVPLSIKVGDEVMFSEYSGIKVDKDHVIVKESAVIGVLLCPEA